MKTRQAVKMMNATRISDLVYLPDGGIGPLKVIGVKPSYCYSFRQFKKAFRITKKYYERKIKQHGRRVETY